LVILMTAHSFPTVSYGFLEIYEQDKHNVFKIFKFSIFDEFFFSLV
jgi:hypothetical protein